MECPGEISRGFFGRGIFHRVGCLWETSEGRTGNIWGFVCQKNFWGRNSSWDKCPGQLSRMCVHVPCRMTSLHVQQLWSVPRGLTHIHTRIQVLIKLRGSSKLHLATCWTSQLPTTSQHHSPTRILPHNYTNIRIHDHTTPTHMSHMRTCTLMMERGFS